MRNRGSELETGREKGHEKDHETDPKSTVVGARAAKIDRLGRNARGGRETDPEASV